MKSYISADFENLPVNQNMSSTKCKSYTVKQKLEIISKSKETSNKATAQIYEEKLEEALCSIRSVSSGKKATYPLAKKELSQWIVQLCQNGIAVTLSSIKLKIKELLRTKFQHDYPNALDTFEASNIQPLDICINKPFKDQMHEKWQNWMVLGGFELTKKENLKRALYDLICQWIVESWNDILADMIVNSFKKCSIPDGIEELDEQVIVSAKDVENLLIPIVYMENSENLPRH
ncbi:23241_t:CDS:2 [Gigaspora margarita]|uniref:23241_t:CDS:1 n=1 Tax=Gigaspora margarita TaxID=4874 RepID=A0ABN7UPK2_GIGMA|nr:23241_t:CDS:2 [Gigaspora margarita]